MSKRNDVIKWCDIKFIIADYMVARNINDISQEKLSEYVCTFIGTIQKKLEDIIKDIIDKSLPLKNDRRRSINARIKLNELMVKADLEKYLFVQRDDNYWCNQFGRGLIKGAVPDKVITDFAKYKGNADDFLKDMFPPTYTEAVPLSSKNEDKFNEMYEWLKGMWQQHYNGYVQSSPDNEEKIPGVPPPNYEIPSEWKILENDFYMIQYPVTFVLDSSITEDWGAEFVIISDLTDNVNLVVMDVDLEIDDFFENYVQSVEKFLNSYVTNCYVFDSEIIIKDGYQFYKMIFSGKQGIHDIMFEQHLTVRKGKFYILTYAAGRSQFKRSEIVRNKIMNSFKLLDKIVYTVVKKSGYTLVNVLIKNLNINFSPQILDKLLTIKEHEKYVIMDISSCELWDYLGGLHLFLKANRIFKEGGGMFILTGVSYELLREFEKTSLDTLFVIADNEEEAVKLLP